MNVIGILGLLTPNGARCRIDGAASQDEMCTDFEWNQKDVVLPLGRDLWSLFDSYFGHDWFSDLNFSACYITVACFDSNFSFDKIRTSSNQ